MRLGAFFLGALIAALLSGIALRLSGGSLPASIGLGLVVLVVAQGLYVVLVALMARDLRRPDRSASPDTSDRDRSTDQ